MLKKAGGGNPLEIPVFELQEKLEAASRLEGRPAAIEALHASPEPEITDKNSATHYRFALERLRAAHGNMKADALTRAHLAAMHLSQADTPSRRTASLPLSRNAFHGQPNTGFCRTGMATRPRGSGVIASIAVRGS